VGGVRAVPLSVPLEAASNKVARLVHPRPNPTPSPNPDPSPSLPPTPTPITPTPTPNPIPHPNKAAVDAYTERAEKRQKTEEGTEADKVPNRP
jgi:hypothetical protein